MVSDGIGGDILEQNQLKKIFSKTTSKNVNKQAMNENVSIDANWYLVYSSKILTMKVNKVSSISLNRY